MNEEQNVNPKPKKKRSFWWLKLLFILILVAAGVIGGIILSSQEYTQKILGEFFPQFAVSSVEDTVPVETLAPETVEKPIEFASPTPAPKPSKAPVEIVSPKAEEKAEPEESAAPEEAVEPKEKTEGEPAAEPSETPAPEESAKPEALPAFAPVTETPAPKETEVAPENDGELIGIDAALESALEHAKLDESMVVVYGVSREKDEGLVYYKVEFLHGSLEYEYEINALTGVVEGWRTVRERQFFGNGYANGNAYGFGYGPNYGAAQTNEDNNAAETAYISLEEAKETALNHAGYREHETTDMKAELDIDNNKLIYDVEFWAEGYDYDYKVCAVTGLILTVEKDRG